MLLADMVPHDGFGGVWTHGAFVARAGIGHPFLGTLLHMRFEPTLRAAILVAELAAGLFLGYKRKGVRRRGRRERSN